MRLVLLTLALLGSAVCHGQEPSPLGGGDALADLFLAADTSTAALRIEEARLDLARLELRATSGLARLRPQLDFFLSVSTRGLAFPSISSQGYDPAYAAIARWPGDTWGVTASWSLEQLLDRRPVQRAQNAVAVAEARIDLHHARRERQEAQARERLIARAEREADEREREAEQQRRADLAAVQLRIEADYLARRVEAQRELLRLAEMKYEQGDLDYEGLARGRLALLSAEHAQATNAARLATLRAGGDPDLALGSVSIDAPEASRGHAPAP